MWDEPCATPICGVEYQGACGEASNSSKLPKFNLGVCHERVQGCKQLASTNQLKSSQSYLWEAEKEQLGGLAAEGIRRYMHPSHNKFNQHKFGLETISIDVFHRENEKR